MFGKTAAIAMFMGLMGVTGAMANDKPLKEPISVFFFCDNVEGSIKEADLPDYVPGRNGCVMVPPHAAPQVNYSDLDFVREITRKDGKVHSILKINAGINKKTGKPVYYYAIYPKPADVFKKGKNSAPKKGRFAI